VAGSNGEKKRAPFPGANAGRPLVWKKAKLVSEEAVKKTCWSSKIRGAPDLEKISVKKKGFGQQPQGTSL